MIRRGDRDQVLDWACQRIEEDAPDHPVLHQALDEMIVLLRDVRAQSSPSEWEEWIAACRGHRLAEILYEDPFTSRAAKKPRGYAGDAKLLDFIYGREEMWPCPKATLRGQRIFEYTTRSPAPEGVRARRECVARMIDRFSERVQTPRILSVAAGHLREALLSMAVKRGKLGRMVALDADERSMQVVSDEYGCYGVETVTASVREMLSDRLDLGEFDLIYSMGLFDYLHDTSSRRLVSNLFQRLAPGGSLVVANFLPGIRDVGYMEAFMDWRLQFRTRWDMMAMTRDLPQDDIKNLSIYAEENQNIIFLEISKM